MHKDEFLEQLRKGLYGLPQDDLEDHISFYSEMIADRMEDGMSEEEAVSAAGSVDKIVFRIIDETPFVKIAKERIHTNRKLNVWNIMLLILGSPIWLSLGIAAAAVVFSLYVSLWSVIISLWAVFASLALTAFGVIVMGIVYIAAGFAPQGFALAGAGVVCIGLSIFMFFGCRGATKGIFILTKKFAKWLKKCFIKKEQA